MPRTRPHLAAAAALLLAPFTLHAQSIATNSPNGQPLSTRVVAYTIDAHLDTDKKSLDATETLTYKNLTGQSLTSIPFHLYLNAFRPESTFTRETHSGGGIRDSEAEDEYPPEKRGSITLSHIDANGYGDLTSALRFIAPDDGNAEDHTVAEIPLPHSLAPNDSITFHLAFHDQFPLSIARNGYKRDFIMGAQWYPKPGVFWHGAWNCHQYHATTEFFSDFATFNVSLNLPSRYVVGATGVPTAEFTNGVPKGTKTLSFYAEDVGDFAWAASPNFTITDGTFLSSMGPVKIHVLALKAHPKAGPRYLDIIQKTMAQFDQRYGPYPYKIVTVIDPEPGSEIGGMEYPTLFTGDTSWYEPTHITELTAEHEFGHQYWYGMVATNEFEDAWLDEGINSYTEVKVLAAILGPYNSVFDRSYANAGDFELQRFEYLGKPDYDPVTRWAFKFRNATSYGDITYGKSSTLLATLEGIIGTSTMDEAMRTYFQRYRFTHPTTEDFLRTIEDVAIARGKAVGSLPKPSPGPAQTFEQDGFSTATLAMPASPPFNGDRTSRLCRHATHQLQPASLLRPGRLRNPGPRLHRRQDLLRARAVVAPRAQRQKEDPIPLHRLSSSQRRLHPPRHSRDRLRRRHPHARALGRSRPLDRIHLHAQRQSRLCRDRPRPHHPSRRQPLQQQLHHNIEPHPGTQTHQSLAKLQPTRRTSSRLDRLMLHFGLSVGL